MRGWIVATSTFATLPTLTLLTDVPAIVITGMIAYATNPQVAGALISGSRVGATAVVTGPTSALIAGLAWTLESVAQSRVGQPLSVQVVRRPGCGGAWGCHGRACVAALSV